MENLTLRQLNRIYELMRDIPGYQRILSMVGFRETTLNLLNEWEDDELYTIGLAEKEYSKNQNKRFELLKEFKEEIDGTESRIEYLLGEKERLESEIGKANQHNKEMKDRFYSPTQSLSWFRLAIMSLYKIGDKNRQLKQITRELHYREHKDEMKEGQINDEMINRAREYPFEQLVDLSRSKFILCPFTKILSPVFSSRTTLAIAFLVISQQIQSSTLCKSKD